MFLKLFERAFSFLFFLTYKHPLEAVVLLHQGVFVYCPFYWLNLIIEAAFPKGKHMNDGGSYRHHPDVSLRTQKGLISEEIKPFIMRLVEISGIEPLTS